jgi:hypothetical protein
MWRLFVSRVVSLTVLLSKVTGHVRGDWVEESGTLVLQNLGKESFLNFTFCHTNSATAFCVIFRKMFFFTFLGSGEGVLLGFERRVLNLLQGALPLSVALMG